MFTSVTTRNIYTTVIYSHEKCDSIYLRRVSKKVGGDYPFKTSDIVQVPNVFWE